MEEWSSTLAQVVPYLLLLGAALLLACGAWIWRSRRLPAAPPRAEVAPRRARQVAAQAPAASPAPQPATPAATAAPASIPAVAPPPAAASPAPSPAAPPAPEAAPEGAPPEVGYNESIPAAAAAAPQAARTAAAMHADAEAAEPANEDAAAAAPAPPPAHAVDAVDAAADAAALAGGLEKTRASFWGRLRSLLSGAPKLDEALLTDVEDVLLTSDVGVGMTDLLLETLKEAVGKQSGPIDAQRLRQLLADTLMGVLQASQGEDGTAALLAPPAQGKPKVVLFVGVNGVGKTTTIGKVAHLFARHGQQAVLAAGDTFRAAAAEQLTIWGERTGARVVRGEPRADPASVMFNAVQAAVAEGADVVLADTAGRLHTQDDLMAEIKKVGKAIRRLREGAPDETWLVVDATTGQNALHQARAFHQALGLTGLVLTKLDGTAKGGVIFAIAHELKLPVRFVGLGERAEMLQPFAPRSFVDALLQ